MTRKRATIGVLLANIDQGYQQEICSGVEDAAKTLGLNVLILSGGSIRSPYKYDSMRNYLHGFLHPENFDGLVLVSTTVGCYSGFQAVVDRFKPLIDALPTVNIGSPYPGLTSVSVDNRSGFRDVIEHLVTVHGKRNFVYVSGLETSVDGIERKEAFLATLAGFGLVPVWDGIIAGDFSYDVTTAAFSDWLDKGIPFDAVVAANDEMAFACHDVLVSRGIRVPDTVALTGFDDTVNGLFYTVPLTSVHQPIRELAGESVRLLSQMMMERAAPEDIRFPTNAVIRQSCGCVCSSVSRARNRASEARTVDDEMRGRLESAFRDFREGATSALPVFLSLFQSYIRMTPPGPEYFIELGTLVSDFERSLWNDPKAESRQACEDALQQVKILIMQQAEVNQANLRIAFSYQTRRTQYSIARLTSAFGLKKFLDQMNRSMPEIGVASCFLSLFVPGTDNARAKLVFARLAGENIALPEEGIEFATTDFFPRKLIPDDGRFDFFVEMVFHDDDQMGILVMNAGGNSLNDALTAQIRSALRASLLMDELASKDASLSVAITELKARAKELEEANVRITHDQAQLVASERMATLGRLTAGIAHEMNTPLAAVRASLSEAGKLVREYRDSVGDPDVTGEDHLAIASEMEKAIDLATRAAERAAGFIRGIKGQTRSSGAQDPGIPFDIVKVVGDVTSLLAHELRLGKCRVEFREPPAPVVTIGKPDKLSQVLTNLVINGIDAMAPDGGTITIGLSEESGSAILEVSDTGCGMSDETLQRMFEPLFTTKPFGVGTGLGLLIARDIITGEFLGTIDVSSVLGKGSRFVVTIPLIKENNDGPKIPENR